MYTQVDLGNDHSCANCQASHVGGHRYMYNVFGSNTVSWRFSLILLQHTLVDAPLQTNVYGTGGRNPSTSAVVGQVTHSSSYNWQIQTGNVIYFTFVGPILHISLCINNSRVFVSQLVEHRFSNLGEQGLNTISNSNFSRWRQICTLDLHLHPLMLLLSNFSCCHVSSVVFWQLLIHVYSKICLYWNRCTV